jgi:hypothetical protein
MRRYLGGVILQLHPRRLLGTLAQDQVHHIRAARVAERRMLDAQLVKPPATSCPARRGGGGLAAGSARISQCARAVFLPATHLCMIRTEVTKT